MPLIDISGIQALEELYHRLKSVNSTLMLCALQPQVQNMIERSSLYNEIGSNAIFWSADQAIIAAHDMHIQAISDSAHDLYV